jgi:predicted ATP-dependent serine protease
MERLACGLTEVHGLPGSGKTTLCLELCRDNKVLWVSKHRGPRVRRLFQMGIPPENFLYIRRSNLEMLADNFHIDAIVEKERVRYVVIHKISDYYVDHAQMVSVSYALKRAISRNSITVIMISDSIAGKRIVPLIWGLFWSYRITRRILVSRDGDKRCIRTEIPETEGEWEVEIGERAEIKFA